MAKEASGGGLHQEPGQREEPSWRAADYTWDPHQLGALKHEPSLDAQAGAAAGKAPSYGATASGGGAALVQRRRSREGRHCCARAGALGRRGGAT